MEQTPIRAIEDDPVLGRYRVHFTMARLRLLLQAGAIYIVSVLIVNIATASLTGTLVNIVVPLLYALIAMPLIWSIAHVWNREVILFERGFTYRQGSVVAAFPYENIVSIRVVSEQVRYFGFLPIQRVRCHMTADQGDEMTITEQYADARKLADALERAITAARKPIVLEMLQRGDLVPFGDMLALDRTRIVDVPTGDALPWTDVIGAAPSGADIRIEAQDGLWRSVPASHIANLLLFITLVRQYRGAAA